MQKDKNLLEKYHSFFFVGIGGIGMSGLAKILLERGLKVRGSDITEGSSIKELRKLGATVHVGHKASNIDGSEVIIYSAAIKNNPELLEAKSRNLPIHRRSELLGAILAEKKGVAVAGTHGKTTTSTLVSLILEKGGYDPTIVVGGEVKSIGGNAKHGKGEYAVAEACEYERSFLDLHPYAAIITNIEADHLDTYKDLDDINQSFEKFIGQMQNDGFLIIPKDDNNLNKIIGNFEGNIITFGVENDANWTARDIHVKGMKTCFTLFKNNQRIAELCLKVPGMHNISNVLASIALTATIGVKFGEIKNTVENFEGVERRFQIKGMRNEVTIIDDYGHHPTEIQTTLKGLRSLYPNRSNRVWCVFQPHQHFRTRLLLHEFANSFDEADSVIIPDIYAVRDTEKDIKSVSSQDLVAEINKIKKKAIYMPTFEDIAEYLSKNVENKDIVITIGAGPVNKVGEILLSKKYSSTSLA